MNNIFKHSSSHWVKYTEYELKKADNGELYVTPKEGTKPQTYDPLTIADAIVLDALNVGLLMMRRAEEYEVKAAIMEFVTKYGLLGLMTALPTTPRFMDYEAVYLLKNSFIKEETLSTENYLRFFYPFKMPEIRKKGVDSSWDISGDRDMMALALTFSDRPMAVNMSFQREYAEPYEWIAAQLKSWAFTMCTSEYYYADSTSLVSDTKDIYRRAMATFDGIAPYYHIELRDRPTIVWDFHSLLLAIQMMFSFAVTDEQTPLRICKHCQNAFFANRPSTVFCSPQCKNQHNVYKNRDKWKES